MRQLIRSLVPAARVSIGALLAVTLTLSLGCNPSSSPSPTAPSTQPPPTSNPEPGVPAAVALASVALAAAEADGGDRVSGTATLTGAAPAAGFAVSLSSSDEAAAVPASVTIAAGQSSGTFVVTTEAVGFEVDVTITAAAGGVSRSAALNIEPAAGDGPIASFTSRSDDVISGDKTEGTVALSAAAPAGGVRFALASSDDDVEVPASFVVAEGKTTGSFEIVTHPVTVEKHVTVTITLAPTAAARGARSLRGPAAAGDASSTLVIVLAPAPPDPPELTVLSPVTGVQAATVAVTLTGANFIDGATVDVSGSGVTASDVTVNSPASITASFAIGADAAIGARDVTVTTSGGTSAAKAFTITALPPTAPTLASISATSGSTLGGTAVTLTGTNLTGATSVTFGGVEAAGVTAVDATTVTATAPAHAAGAVDVVVTTPAGSATLADGFTYVLPAPTITDIDPASGTTAGGELVTLTGTVLTDATAVTFDGVAATGVTVVNATTVTATTPAHAAGVVDVAITTSGGSATLSNGYTYVAPPTLTAVSANSGTAFGSVGVTLTGTNLTGATSVTFGGVPATFVNVVDATTVTAVTPAQANGEVDVVVTTPLGDATLPNGYTYVAIAPGQSAAGGALAASVDDLVLIASTVDNGSGVMWGPASAIPGAQSTSDGAANTAAIVAALGDNGGQPYAAGICSAYEVDSLGSSPCQPGRACYDDWFLPALNDVIVIFPNVGALTSFVFFTPYWMSTESSATQAHIFAFTPGALGTLGNKDDANGRVRCIRWMAPSGGR